MARPEPRVRSRNAWSLMLGMMLGIALGAPLAAQPMPVVLESDVVPGVGAITSIANIAINSSGTWIVEADTDAAATDFDSVLLRDGVLFFTEGDLLGAPMDAGLDTFDSVTINDNGQHGFNFFLEGATISTSDDSGIYAYLDTAQSAAAGTVLVLRESDFSPDLPSAPVIGFFDVKINNAGQLLAVASVDDPAIASTVDRTLSIITTDEVVGGVVSSILIGAEGDVLPGQVDALTDFGTSPHETAINDAGAVLFAVDIPSGDAIYLYDAGVYTVIAQEGEPAPVAGRLWSSLTSTALDVNNNGDYVFRGSMDGDSSSNSILVRNGDKFRQEGDPAPGGFVFTSFGTGPVEISDSGNVLWYGDWDDPNTDIDTGLFLDDVLLVQEGVTEVPGLGIIDTLRGVEDGYHMSSDGAYIIFEAILESGLEGAFVLMPGGPGPGSPDFVRGDSNVDGGFDISDAIFTLAALFTPGSPAWSCPDSGDANDDGAVNIADAVYTLAALFTPGSPLPPAPTSCGQDPTMDSLDCPEFAACP